MTQEEVQSASVAMWNWLIDQQIAPADAVPVLAQTILVCVAAISGDDEAHQERGIRYAANLLLAAERPR